MCTHYFSSLLSWWLAGFFLISQHTRPRHSLPQISISRTPFSHSALSANGHLISRALSAYFVIKIYTTYDTLAFCNYARWLHPAALIISLNEMTAIKSSGAYCWKLAAPCGKRTCAIDPSNWHFVPGARRIFSCLCWLPGFCFACCRRALNKLCSKENGVSEVA